MLTTRGQSVAIIFSVVATILILGRTTASAQVVNKCQGAKHKCVGKKQKSLLTCHSKAESKGTVVDTLCADKAETGFAACMTKAEAKGACLTTADTDELEAKTDAFIEDVVHALDPSYPDPIPGGNRCSADKKKCVAKQAGGLLACHAKANSSGALSPACVAKAEAGLAACFNKAEATPPCLTTNDAVAIGDKVGAFVDSVVCALDPSAGTCPSPPQIAIAASDNTQFEATVTFDAPRFATIEAGGETWTQVTVPGLESHIGPPGMPAVPSWQALVAIPHGATVTLEQGGVATIRETRQMNLVPFQSQAVDQLDARTFSDKPFVKDAQAYATNAFFPPSPCAVKVLGSMRDLEIAQVQCNAGQYNPVSGEMHLFDETHFKLHFQGGEGTFISSQSLSPFEAATHTSMGWMLNSAVLSQFVKYIDPSTFLSAFAGEELLILTHPDFRNAADTLATWKRKKGIASTVMNVGPGTPYDTGSKIIDLIHGRYDTCLTRVSYVLLVGDSEFIPPAREDYDITSEDDTSGSDWGYAVYPHPVDMGISVDFPTFAVGRIPVDSLSEAQTVVDKIVQYESNPPFVDFGSGSPFYDTASLASQFQCCSMYPNGKPVDGNDGTDQRGFIESAESVHDALVADGYDVQRIYTTTVNHDDDGACNVTVSPGSPCPTNQVQQPYSGKATPVRYHDGNLLPKALRSSSGFTWSGTTGDITDAFNDGRFLIIHRDHGNGNGWGSPSFTTSNLSTLTNGAELPVVYSVNCKSAYWDKETDTDDPSASESFMERLLLRPNGGMVSGIGDVRNSPTWANSALLRGLADATWPDLEPEFGDSPRIRRLGDILTHGKAYLATQVGLAQSGTDGSVVAHEDYTNEQLLYHVLGDPTLEMWTRNPWPGQVLSGVFQASHSSSGLLVSYAVEGAEITALQPQPDGTARPIARGTVKNGVATLPYISPDLATLNPASLMLSASLADKVSVQLQEPARYIDNGDGTVTDTSTGLQWEKKTDDGTLRDKDNQYQWAGKCSVNTSKFCQPTAAAEALCEAQTPAAYWASGCQQCTGGDGVCNVSAPSITTVWDWIDDLRTSNFAGHADWRLPSEDGCNSCYSAGACACVASELESILLAPYPCATDPCIAPEFGPTKPFVGFYWSASTNAAIPGRAWEVYFSNAGTALADKDSDLFIRAVR